MNIGILSMQEVKNYGSFLQAFSLKNTIQSLGHECGFVNIVPGEQLGDYKIGHAHRLKLLAERLRGRDFASRLKYIYKFQHRFSSEFLPALGVGRGRISRHFDTVVIGSDEVFNCAQKTWWGFSPQLFGQGLDADKVITYAASFGATTVPVLESLGIKETVASLLKDINSVSVRDDNSSNVVCELTGREPFRHVDPVIIFDYSRFMPDSVDTSGCCLVYTYPGRITDKAEIAAIRQFASAHGLQLVSIGHYFPWVDKVVVPTPFEVLACFKSADFVITDTFHGSVFSLKYNKRFATLVRDMNSNKLTSLLRQFGLEDRIARCAADIPSIMDRPIDYDTVNAIMELETNRSVEYLKDRL